MHTVCRATDAPGAGEIDDLDQEADPTGASDDDSLLLQAAIHSAATAGYVKRRR